MCEVCFLIYWDCISLALASLSESVPFCPAPAHNWSKSKDFAQKRPWPKYAEIWRDTGKCQDESAVLQCVRAIVMMAVISLEPAAPSAELYVLAPGRFGKENHRNNQHVAYNLRHQICWSHGICHKVGTVDRIPMHHFEQLASNRMPGFFHICRTVTSQKRKQVWRENVKPANPSKQCYKPPASSCTGADSRIQASKWGSIMCFHRVLQWKFSICLDHVSSCFDTIQSQHRTTYPGLHLSICLSLESDWKCLVSRLQGLRECRAARLPSIQRA